MKTSEQEIQKKLGYSEADIKDALSVNLKIYNGFKLTDSEVLTHLSKYVFALAANAYEKGKCPVITEPEKSAIEVASHEIDQKFRGVYSWFQAVGIGNNELVIYTTVKKVPKLLTDYNGFPIKYKYVGKIKPASINKV